MCRLVGERCIGAVGIVYRANVFLRPPIGALGVLGAILAIAAMALLVAALLRGAVGLASAASTLWEVGLIASLMTACAGDGRALMVAVGTGLVGGLASWFIPGTPRIRSRGKEPSRPR